MSQIHYLRVILLLNNLVAGTIALAGDKWRWDRGVWDAMGSFLFISWLVNLVTLLLTSYILRRSSTSNQSNLGHYAIAVAEEQEMSEEVDDGSLQPDAMPLWLSVIILLWDLIFIIVFATLFGIGVSNIPSTQMAFAVIGSMVALIVHLFFFLYRLFQLGLHRYTVKISIERRRRGVSFGTLSRRKEQRLSPDIAQPQEQSQQAKQQKPSSPTYHGSPSHKASQGSSPSTLKLVDPTESDSLIGDQE